VTDIETIMINYSVKFNIGFYFPVANIRYDRGLSLFTLSVKYKHGGRYRDVYSNRRLSKVIEKVVDHTNPENKMTIAV
jgi:hypothetical protein